MNPLVLSLRGQRTCLKVEYIVTALMLHNPVESAKSNLLTFTCALR